MTIHTISARLREALFLQRKQHMNQQHLTGLILHELRKCFCCSVWFGVFCLYLFLWDLIVVSFVFADFFFPSHLFFFLF